MGGITGQQIKDESINGDDIQSASVPESDLILNFPTAELKANIVSEAFARKAHDISADENLGNLWVDDLNDNTGISTSGANTTSGGYTYRGASNYDIIKAGETVGQNQTNSDGGGDFFHTDGPRTIIGQSFITGSSEIGPITKVNFKLYKVGSPTGNIWCEIRTDNGSGMPSDTILATSTTIDVSTLTSDTNGAVVSFAFSSPATPSGSTKYHAVINGNLTPSGTNYPVGRKQSGNSYANGTCVLLYNGVWQEYSSGWDMYFEIYQTPSSANVYSITAVPAASISAALFVWEQTTGTGTITAYGSCDGGAHWTEITSPSSFASLAGTTYYKYVTGMTTGTDIRLKIVITGDSQLENWGIGW